MPEKSETSNGIIILRSDFQNFLFVRYFIFEARETQERVTEKTTGQTALAFISRLDRLYLINKNDGS